MHKKSSCGEGLGFVQLPHGLARSLAAKPPPTESATDLSLGLGFVAAFRVQSAPS